MQLMRYAKIFLTESNSTHFQLTLKHSHSGQNDTMEQGSKNELFKKTVLKIGCC